MEIKIDIETTERKDNLRIANVEIDKHNFSFFSNDRNLYNFLKNLIRNVDVKVREYGEE